MPEPKSKAVPRPNDEESSSDSEEEPVGDLGQVRAGFMEECKMVCRSWRQLIEPILTISYQVLIVRQDLGMTKGEEAISASRVSGRSSK